MIYYYSKSAITVIGDCKTQDEIHSSCVDWKCVIWRTWYNWCVKKGYYLQCSLVICCRLAEKIQHTSSRKKTRNVRPSTIIITVEIKNFGREIFVLCIPLLNMFFFFFFFWKKNLFCHSQTWWRNDFGWISQNKLYDNNTILLFQNDAFTT